jgi:serine/threonine protein kinase
VSEPARTDESIFAAAAALPAGDRPALLARLCADPAQRARVEGLLRSHDVAGSFLQTPPPAPTADYDPAPERPGSAVGPYKLLEKIGEGGMGEVWVADQTDPIRRRVAVKLIKPGMDSRSVLARFEQERQALALMDHPNIAKVLDAGTTPDGRPYFVMELVKGTPITAFCDARKLSPRERLKLFVPVCQAIQHAHQKGVIHRDIKPGNVLVELYDDRAVPKVIDFGVAKAVGRQLTDKTLYTGFGALIGTPAYMAPEQATFNALDVDTRADVYALGVLLYELLAGSPPFEPERLRNAALDEVLRLVREEEPPRPSARLSTSQTKASIAAVRQSDPAKLAQLVRGELDWIVMTALEKDRARRYETASGLARDVERYLRGDAVDACPPTLSYRLRKAYRRNRGPVIAVGLVLVTLVAGVIGTTAGLVQADGARRAEAEQRNLAEAERDEKERARAAAVAEQQRAEREKARADDEAAVAKAVNDFLFEDLLKPAAKGPLALGRKAPPDPNVTVRALMERAEQSVAERFRDRPLIEAAVREVIARSYTIVGRGEYGPAIANLTRAADLKAAHYGPNHPKALRARLEVAQAYRYLPERSDRTYQILDGVRTALATLPDPLGDEACDVLYWLASGYGGGPAVIPLWERYLRNARMPTDAVGDLRRAATQTRLAQAYREAGRPVDFDRVLGDIRRAAERSAEAIPDEDQAVRLIHLASDLDYLVRRPVWEAVLPGLRRWADRLDAAGDRGALSAWLQVAWANRMAKRPADALAAGERARAVLTRLEATGGEPPGHHRDRLFRDLGRYYLDNGRPAEAAAAFERAWALTRAEGGIWDTGWSDLALTAEAYRQAGRPADVLPLLREAADPILKIGGPKSRSWMELQTEFALTYLAAGRPAEALEALAPGQKWDPAKPDALRAALARRAREYRGHYAKAAEIWDRVVSLTPDPGPARIDALSQRAVNRVRTDRLDLGLKEADEVAATKVPVGLYNAACAFSIASGSRGLSAERAEELARRSVELLAQARAAGYFDDPKRAVHAKTDPDLDWIRKRPELPALIAGPPTEQGPPPREVRS